MAQPVIRINFCQRNNTVLLVHYTVYESYEITGGNLKRDSLSCLARQVHHNEIRGRHMTHLSE